MLIDFDFRFDPSLTASSSDPTHLIRQYTLSHIKIIIDIYMSCPAHYQDLII